MTPAEGELRASGTPISAAAEKRLAEVVYQAIGAASVCWSNDTIFHAGVYESDRAKLIANTLIDDIRELVKEWNEYSTLPSSSSSSQSSSPS